jgi:hypothetical protein
MVSKYFIYRVSPISPLQLCNSIKFTNKIYDFHREEFELSNAKQNILEKLHSFNKSIYNADNQKKIQNLRRDIHNHRKLSEKLLQDVLNVLPIDLAENLKKYIYELEKVLNSKQDLILEFEGAKSIEELSILNTWEIESSISMALPLSSCSFAKDVMQILIAKNDIASKKTKKTLLSSYKYQSRIACKTSPFSFFTHVGLGEFVEAFDQKDSLNKELSFNNYIRLNNSIFGLLKYLLQNSNGFKYLNIKANGSIQVENGFYALLHSSRNIEFVNKIEIKPILQLIRENTIFAQPFEKVVKLLTKLTDASEEKASQYLVKLIDQGFLCIEYGISGLDLHWPEKFLKLLESVDSIETQKISALIRELLEIKPVFLNGDVKTRLLCLEQAFLAINSLCMNFPFVSISGEISQSSKEKILPFYHIKKENIFFEDVIALEKMYLEKAFFQQIESTIANLGTILQVNDFRLAERNSLLSFFKTNYGVDDRVPVLKLYHDYYKKSKLDLIKKDIKNKFLPKDETTEEILRNIRNTLADEFSNDLISISDVFNIDSKRLRNLERNKSGDTKEVKSFSIYFQMFIDGDCSPKIISNGLGTGHGCQFSRFLHYFPENVLTDLVEDNYLCSSNDKLLVEVADGSSFNANIRPQIYPYEIVLPGANAISSTTSHLSVSDFCVSFNELEENLELIHVPSEKKVEVYNTSFESFIGRSNLFNLLQIFNPNPILNFNLIIEAINKLTAKEYAKKKIKSDVIFYPRIQIDNSIVIQRAFWLISLNKWLVKIDTDNEFFVTLNLWRTQNNIPTEVFYTIKNDKPDFVFRGESLDDYFKPQYLNFEQIYSVILLKKNLKHTSEFLKIEEMLPNTEMLMHGNQKVVTEYVVQFNPAKGFSLKSDI